MTDRRQFLASSAACITAGISGTKATSNVGIQRAKWDAAMRQFHDKEAEREHFAATVHDPAYERSQAGGPRVDKAINDKIDRLTEELSNLRWKLINMPAPDSKAVMWKLDYLLEDNCDGYTHGYHLDCFTQTLADLRRLMGDA